MSAFKERYVIFCQQMLATALVLSFGVGAASVLNLDFQSPENSQTPKFPQPKIITSPSPAPVVASAPIPAKPTEPVANLVPVSPKITTVDVVKPNRKSAKSSTALIRKEITVNSSLLLLAATWKPDPKVNTKTLQISVQTKSVPSQAWSAPTALVYQSDHDAEFGGKSGTEPVTTNRVSKILFTVRATVLPKDLNLLVIDPGSNHKLTTKLTAAKVSLARSTSPQRLGTVPQPTIFSRAQWGADESIREASALRYGTIQAGFIHHTVNTNDYSADQVPALLRGIYAYHVKGRGWSDIGYNFIADRFGRIWEGRYGGITKPVQGAHTLNYNDVAFAMSALGNFEETEPSPELLRAYANLFAWKLSLAGIDAADLSVSLHGRNFAAINGHRDAASTACPGENLYTKVPQIRAMAAAIQKNSLPKPKPVPLPKRVNLVGEQWPDLLLRRATDGKIFVKATAGITKWTPAKLASFGAAKNLARIEDRNQDSIPELIVNTGTSWSLAVSDTNRWQQKELPEFSGFDYLAPLGNLRGDWKQEIAARKRLDGTYWLFEATKTGYRQITRLTSIPKGSKLFNMNDLTGDGRNEFLWSRKGQQRIVKLVGSQFLTLANLRLPSTQRPLGAVDFTGDGHPDLMVANSNYTQFQVRAGLGGYQFDQAFGDYNFRGKTAKILLPQQTKPGFANITTLQKNGSVLIYRHNQHNNFAGMISAGFSATAATQILNLGDLNKDGFSDLAIKKPTSDRLTIRFGNGNGAWPVTKAVGSGFAKAKNLTAVGDITKDGIADLIAKIGGKFQYFAGDGIGGFRAPVPLNSLRSFAQIGAGTWEVSGNKLISKDGSIIPITATNLDARLAAAGVTFDRYLALGDANGDDLADLFAIDTSGQVWLFPAQSETQVGAGKKLGSSISGYDLVG